MVAASFWTIFPFMKKIELSAGLLWRISEQFSAISDRESFVNIERLWISHEGIDFADLFIKFINFVSYYYSKGKYICFCYDLNALDRSDCLTTQFEVLTFWQGHLCKIFSVYMAGEKGCMTLQVLNYSNPSASSFYCIDCANPLPNLIPVRSSSRYSSTMFITTYICAVCQHMLSCHINTSCCNL